MFEDLVSADDGHPQMGKELKHHFGQAGFANILVTSSFDIYSTPDDVEFIYGFATQWFFGAGNHGGGHKIWGFHQAVVRRHSRRLCPVEESSCCNGRRCLR